MSRPESGRPAGWGLSMAGSLAINIYSASRAAEESTRLEPAQRRAAESLNTHTRTNTVECCRPHFPTQRNYSTGRQTGPSVCCFWPHGFLCQESTTFSAARYGCRNMITAAKTLKMKNQVLLLSITGGSCLFSCCGFTEMGDSALLTVVLAVSFLSISAAQLGEKNITLWFIQAWQTPPTLMVASSKEKPSHCDHPLVAGCSYSH